jgi:hypothetical protein
MPFGNLRRYRLPLKGKRASYETISDQCMELPRFDYGATTWTPATATSTRSASIPRSARAFTTRSSR